MSVVAFIDVIINKCKPTREDSYAKYVFPNLLLAMISHKINQLQVRYTHHLRNVNRATMIIARIIIIN
jgi:hypothetical protein